MVRWFQGTHEELGVFPSKHAFITGWGPVRHMVLECNIDARGKAIRLFGGMASVITGLGVATVAYFGLVDSSYLWYASAGLLAGGTLGVFEGWSGWCVARAIGIWTPI